MSSVFVVLCVFLLQDKCHGTGEMTKAENDLQVYKAPPLPEAGPSECQCVHVSDDWRLAIEMVIFAVKC